jgi:3-oxoacyl-[acyl-carrier-protein] synthase-3
MLETGGITSRHLAIDPETHRLTHTVASLAEEAARRALDAAGRKPTDIDLLLLSAPNYDFSTPPTSTILQERLGIESCAEMEVHSNCAGVGKCVQIAYDALRAGRYKTALVTYSQLSSVYLRNCYFNQPMMNKNQAALRYILADGSGALVLEAVEVDNGAPVPHEIIGTHIESVGGKLPPAMTAGAGVADLLEYEARSVFERGTHHLDQDFTAVAQNAAPRLMAGVARMLEGLKIDPRTVDHFVYSIPNKSLYDNNLEKITKPFDATPEQVKFRAEHTGYVGGASILLHFDEMVRAGEFKSGQTIVLSSVESSKWMTAGFVVRW